MYLLIVLFFAVILSECSERIGDSSRAPATLVESRVQSWELSFPSSTAMSSSSYNRPITPRCYNMEELPDAASERARLREILSKSDSSDLGREEQMLLETPLARHLLRGLAYTVGSALGYDPPTREECLTAFVIPNKVGLTTGARAWSKHGHRSQGTPELRSSSANGVPSGGWWGTPSGSVAGINEKALSLFGRVVDNAEWRNLHWLPHQVLVYEVRVEEGYGMRWSQDWSSVVGQAGNVNPLLQQTTTATTTPAAWVFRGFVEPMMDDGHQVGWRH